MDEAVRRLSQYRPFANEGRDTRAALSDLVLASALENDGLIPSLGHCREACQVLWGLELELDEIRSFANDLVQDGRLVPEGPGFRIAEAAATELKFTLQESEAVEREAMAEWEATVRAVTPGVTDDDMAALRDDLDAWLRQVMARHGVEAALILYPDSDEAREKLGEIEALGFDFLPERGKRLESIREQAFFLFVTRPTEKQQILLANLLNTEYFLTVLTLDPRAKEVVQDIAAGQLIYLDTNILYRILNLNTPRQFLSINRLLALTKDLGYRLAVTPWTVAELRRSLERARDYLKSKPIPPGELAALAAEATTDENFITAYWRRIRDKPVSVDDFFEFYNEIEAHLAQHDIAVVDDAVLTVERDTDAITEQMSVIERVPGPRTKPEPVKEHDVKCRLLVLRRRGGDRRFARAGFWFLTADSSLPRYDIVAQAGGKALPFCMTTSAWLQVMRSFLPRTKDMDQTLTDLLSSPYIRYRGRISYETVQEVTGRLELFRGATPGVAASVLFNTALLREVAETPEEEARRELIDNAVVAAAADLERQLTEERRRTEEERAARAEALTKSHDLAEQLASEQTELRALEQSLSEERRAREAETREARDALDRERIEKGEAIEALQATISQQAETLVSLQVWLKRSVGVLFACAAVAGAVLPIVTHAAHGPLTVVLVITAGVLMLVAAIGLLIGWKRSWILFAGVSVVVGFAAGVYDFLR